MLKGIHKPVMDDYWKGHIIEIREHRLPEFEPQQLVRVLWYYKKADILEEMENCDGGDDNNNNNNDDDEEFGDDIKR